MNPMVMGPSMFPSDNSPNNQLAGLRMRKRTMVYPGEMVKVGEIFGVKGRYWGQGEILGSRGDEKGMLALILYWIRPFLSLWISQVL